MADELEARVDAAFGEFDGDEKGGAKRVKSNRDKIQRMREQADGWDETTPVHITVDGFVALLDFIESLDEKIVALEAVQKDMPHGLALFRRGEGGDDRGVEIIPLGNQGEILPGDQSRMGDQAPQGNWGNQSPGNRFSDDFSRTESAPQYGQSPLQAAGFPQGMASPPIEDEHGVPIDGGGLALPEFPNSLRELANRARAVIRGSNNRAGVAPEAGVDPAALQPEVGVDPAVAGADRTAYLVHEDSDLEIMRNAIQEEIARLPNSVEDEEERDREVLFFIFDVSDGWNNPEFLAVLLGNESDVSYARLGGRYEITQLKEANRREDGSLPNLMGFVVSISGDGLISL